MALNARRKMGSYLIDENESELPDLIGGRQGAKPQKGIPLTHCIYLEKVAGVTGIEPAASNVTGRKEMRNRANLQTQKDNTGQ